MWRLTFSHLPEVFSGFKNQECAMEISNIVSAAAI